MVKRKNNKKWNELIYFCLGLLVLLVGYFTTNANNTSSSYDNNTNSSTSEVLVYFIDVGQADAIYIKDGNSNMMIDAGNNADGKLLVKYLQSLNVRGFKYVVGTHAHEDHIGGMDDIVNNFKIDSFYMPEAISTSKTFEDVLDALDKNKVTFQTPKIGDKFALENTNFEVLSIGNDTSDLNDTSLVLKMSYNNTCVLFMGDASSNVEKNLLDKDINCQVLKVGHHGSRYSSSDEFIKTVNPTYGIIMVGEGNKYGHPTKKTLDILNKYKVTIHRTDKEGTIVMLLKGDDISFENFKTETNG